LPKVWIILNGVLRIRSWFLELKISPALIGLIGLSCIPPLAAITKKPKEK
jgi:hypothetical protein